MRKTGFSAWIFCFFLGFFLSLGVAFCQTGGLSGVVQGEHQIPVKGADVVLKGSRLFTGKTDSLGTFRFFRLSPGIYTLIIAADGRNTHQEEIRIDSGKVEREIFLVEKSKILQEVEVKAGTEKTFGIRRMNAVENFGIYEGKKSEVVVLKDLAANLSTNNPRQVYGKVTGLNIWESDGAGLQLGIGGRGLSPNRTANFNVRQNGYDISADALGYPESYYTPPTEALEQIEIVRGAASLQYGTQFGGLLNFRFRKGPSDRKMEVNTRQTVGSWGFFNSFTSVGGTVANGKLNYFGYGQYKAGQGFRQNAGFRYGNGFLSAEYTFSPKWTLGLELTKMAYLAQQPGGLTDRNFQDNPRQSLRSRNWFEVDWNLAALLLTWKPTERTRLNIRNFGLSASRLALGNLERINVADLGGNRTLIDGRFQNVGNETRLLHQYNLKGQGQTFLTGFRIYRGVTTARQGDASNGRAADFRFLNPSDPENSDFRFPNLNVAWFAENIFNLSDQWTLTPGIRWEYIQTQSVGYYQIQTFDGAGNLVARQRINEDRSRNRTFLLGGLGISHKPNEEMELYGNISQNYRAINFSDLRIVNPNFVVDTNIRDEKGFTADLGLKGKRQGKWMFELTAFYLYYQGKIGQILRADRPPLFLDYRYRGNISNARNIGIELFGEVELLGKSALAARGWNASLFLNGALVDARYVATDDPTIRNKKVEMVPPVMVRSGTSLRKGAFHATLQVSYVQQHFSDATNATRTSTAVEGIIPSYTVLDLSVRYAWRRYGLEASVNNLTNEAYFTRRAEAYPGPGIIPSDGRGFYITAAARF